MTTIPTAVVERRSAKQAVEIRLRVSGYPDIDDQDAIQTLGRAITPEVVVINYVRMDLGSVFGVYGRDG
ncbi:MAG: hypothetical protein ACRDTT_35740 [Pseudonocardiaceae bacterium]